MSSVRCSFQILTENIVDYHTRLAGPWDLKATQITAGGFTSRHSGVTDGRSVVYEESFQGGMALDCALASGFVVFSLPNAAARSGKWWGRVFPEGRIAYSTGGREIAAQFPSGYGNLVAIMPENDFRTEFEFETGMSPDFLDGEGHYLFLAPGYFKKLCRVWGEFVRPDPDPLALSRRGSLCRDLARSLAAAIPLPPSSLCMNARGRDHVRKMDEIFNDTDGRADLDEICAALQISRCSLELQARLHLGVTPHRYLRLKRMNRAYEALLRADPADSQVKEIAANCSFQQLGRFAVEYRKLFGETPSATLQRPALPQGGRRIIGLEC